MQSILPVLRNRVLSRLMLALMGFGLLAAGGFVGRWWIPYDHVVHNQWIWGTWNVLCLTGSSVVWLRLLRLHRLLRRAKNKVCPRCGYDLSGCDDAGRCPECGRVYTQQSLSDAWGGG